MQTIEAIYENGVFRPIQSDTNGLKEGDHVQLTVETVPIRRVKAAEMLTQLQNVYAGLTEAEIEEVERIALASRGVVNGKLVTNNTRHFDRIPALVLQNWLLP